LTPEERAEVLRRLQSIQQVALPKHL
jgi:hypothetical protein